MNFFLKILGKKEIKYFEHNKHKNNPPKKCLLKPKSLRIQGPKNIKKRIFGKELQNLQCLTEEIKSNFNHKKRKRTAKDILSNNIKENINNKCNNNSLNNIMENNFIKEKNMENKINLGKNDNKNKINKNNEINIENKGINNNNKEVNNHIYENQENINNKENINYLNEQNIQRNDKESNNNIININSKKINLIKININTINTNINANIANNDTVKKNENINELKIIKVNILPQKEKDMTLIYENNKIRYNLQRAKEYLDEIYIFLKSREETSISKENYMTLIQTDINEKMRTILINWLIEVHFKFRLLNETLFLCINIIDRYLSQKDINRKYLQLLGITALFISCKYEEIYAPHAKDLIYMTDNAYKLEEMIKMENEILSVIKFELTIPTSLNFLKIYGTLLNLDEKNFFRCYYLNELSLINYNLCKFYPSLIACVCLFINLKSDKNFFKGYNEQEMFKITGYNKQDIVICLEEMVKSLNKVNEINNKFISIKKKYALDKYMKVSNDCFMINDN